MNNSEEDLYVEDICAFLNAAIDDLDQSGVRFKVKAERNDLLALVGTIRLENGWPKAAEIASTIVDRLAMLLRSKLIKTDSSTRFRRFANDWEAIKAITQRVKSLPDEVQEIYFESVRTISRYLVDSVPSEFKLCLEELGVQPEFQLPGLTKLEEVLRKMIVEIAKSEPVLDFHFDDEENDNDDDDDESDGLFGFKMEDVIIVETFIGAAKSALTRDDISTSDRIRLAKFMHCLKKLPRITPGVSFEFSLKTQDLGNGFSYRSVQITEEEFKVSSGGYEQGPHGGDSYSQELFEVGEGWQSSEVMKFDLLSWAEGFAEDASNKLMIVSIEDYTGEEIDLEDDEDTSHLWGLLDSDY